jgi:hypothetical protein
VDKVGLLVRCKSCSCRFRVVAEGAGKYGVREEVAATEPPIPPPPSAPKAPHPIKIKPPASPPQNKAAALAKPAPKVAANGSPPAKAPAATPRSAQPARPPQSGAMRWVPVVLLGIILAAAVAIGGLLLFPDLLPSKEQQSGSVVPLGKYGGIEVGSTGIKRIAVEYFQVGNDVKVRLLDEPVDVNANLSDPKQEKHTHFDPDLLRHARGHIRDYYKALHNTNGIPDDHIFVVCSSGVLANFTDPDALARNRKDLTEAIREETGRTPGFVDAHDEAKYALQATVPAKDRLEAVLVDIGGENIKGGSFDTRGNFYDFTVKGGVKGFEREVAKAVPLAAKARAPVTAWSLVAQAACRQSIPAGAAPFLSGVAAAVIPDGLEYLSAFTATARRLRETKVEAPLRRDLTIGQDLRDRKKVYFLGGIAWAMSTYVRPDEFYSHSYGDQPRYHNTIAAKDFDDFAAMVQELGPEAIKAKVLAGLPKNELWVKDVRSNIDKIQKEVFKGRERLIGGAQVLRGVANELGIGKEPREIFGYRYGHIAWLLGYVGEQSGHVK